MKLTPPARRESKRALLLVQVFGQHGRAGIRELGLTISPEEVRCDCAVFA
jgi:hypothetical protein